MDYKVLMESSTEVFWLTIIAFFPLLLNIAFEGIRIDSMKTALISKMYPSELLAFCISFLAPSIYFLKKSHGNSYKLPFLNFYFFLTIFMYMSCLTFVFTIKNNLEPQVVKNIVEKNIYLIYSFVFLLITILFRIYSSYHSKRPIDFKGAKKEDQDKFNELFKETVNG